MQDVGAYVAVATGALIGMYLGRMLNLGSFTQGLLR